MLTRTLIPIVGVIIITTQTGCITTSIIVGTMLLSSGKQDKATKDLEKQLKGKAPSEADRLLGARLETLTDTRKAGRELLLYKVKGDKTGAERYAVDLDNGNIVALTKGRQTVGDTEAAVKAADLRKRLIGKTADEVKWEANIGKPLAVLRSRERDQVVRIYDAKDLKKAKGARYCVLRFGKDGRCAEVNLIGIQSSSKKDPAKG